MDYLRRTWAEISLDALRHNHAVIRARLPQTCGIMSVVKADAYGHGVRYVARALDDAGTDWFGVSNLEEALQLRALGIKKPVLILGYTPPACAETLAHERISQTVFSTEYAAALSDCAARAGVMVDIHIKLDTGMHRLGFCCDCDGVLDSTADAAAAACRLPGLRAQGVFTHFPSADYDGDCDGAVTKAQFARFLRTVGLIEARGVRFEVRHCCNSAAVLEYPEMHLDLVRPGIILYGLMPSEQVQNPGLIPAMQLRTVVSMVKHVRAGETVSYGRTFTASGDRTVATVPIGYADGYPRALSGRAHMLVNGCRAPVVGRVCMDQLMLDVTGIPDVRAGMTATVFGRDGDEFLPVEEISALAGTINYETVCLIGKRVTRVFLDGGREVGHIGLLEQGGAGNR